jgi:hypothetical protein
MRFSPFTPNQKYFISARIKLNQLLFNNIQYQNKKFYRSK